MSYFLLLCVLVQFTGAHPLDAAYCTRSGCPKKVEDLLKGEVLRGCVNLGMGPACVCKVAILMGYRDGPSEPLIYENEYEYNGPIGRHDVYQIEHYPQFGIDVHFPWDMYHTHLTPEHLDGGIGP